MNAIVEVKVGQIWKDLEPRLSYKRLLKVIEIRNGKARVQSPSELGPRTWIRLDRFKPNARGYALEKDV